MNSNNNVVDESVDDGIPPNFLNEFIDGMDNPALQVGVEQSRTAQMAQERLRKFNDAWNILPNNSSVPNTTNESNEPQPGTSAATMAENKRVETNNANELPIQNVTQPAPAPLTPAEGLLGSPSSLQIIDDAPRPSTATDGLTGRSASNNRVADGGRNSVRRRHSSDDEGYEREDMNSRYRRAARLRRQRSRSRSGSPAEYRRPRQFRSRTPPRSRSRFASRSPRRRRTPFRSRSPPRSRSISRERRSSRSSENERRHRPSNRRNRHAEPTVAPPTVAAQEINNVTIMAQSMMAMMQMFNQYVSGVNPLQPALPVQFGNLLQAPSVGQVGPIPINHTPSTHPLAPASSSLHVDTSTQMRPQPATDDAEIEPQYDGTTELFLEGRMHFGQYLRERPSCMMQHKVNPKVCERIKEAAFILERQVTNEQMAKFLYVPPYYYSEFHKKENRSPLIWNERNVLFGLTSSSREVKHCEPFGNVNGKLKRLLAKLGLDEGAISQQLQRNALAPVNGAVASEKGARIQAISTLPPKPGSARVRHVIERAVQTEGYACGGCVDRAKKTFVASGTQTPFAIPRKSDTAVQTLSSLEENPFVPTITLENLTSSQIETIDAIVRFIRTRHVTGPVDAVQHALNRDSTARTTMSPGLFQSAQDVMSMMTEQPSRAISPYASSSNATSGYLVSIQQHVQHTRPTASTNFQPQAPPAPTTSSVGGRYFQAYNSQEVILPTCYSSQPQMSRKARKRMNRMNRQE